MSAWELVEVTDRAGSLVKPEWLRRAERVHRQLRPKMPVDYAAKMQRVFDGGGRMLIATLGEVVSGVAIWRSFENTVAGRHVYVDDLVTDEAHRSRGAGKALLSRCAEIAAELGCHELVLDSGVQRTEAHKFYFREGLAINAFNFSKRIVAAGPPA